MKPPQSKREEDEIYDIQAWLDEGHELECMGDIPLPAAYKISALKEMATNRSREEHEIEERRMVRERVAANRGESPEAMYKAVWEQLIDHALNRTKDKMIESRENPKEITRGGADGSGEYTTRIQS